MPVEKIPSWIERLLMPKLSEISGEIKAVNTRIDALESNMNIKIDSLDERMNIRINGLDGKIDSLRNEIKSDFKGLDYRFESIDTHLDSLEKRIPVIEEITALKIKIAELEKKMAMA